MDQLRITVDGQVFDVVVEKVTTSSPAASPAPTPVVRAAAPAPAPAPAPVAAAPAACGAGDCPSPLAGIVQAIDKVIGTQVSEGELVLTLEAMKMYTPINAHCTGTITAIHVKVADAVEEGQALFTIG